MFGRLQRWHTIYTFWELLPRNGILPAAKFTLRPSSAFSYIGTVTARHSSSGRQPNSVAWYRERNYGTFSEGATIYSTGRPSRWALAHILVITVKPHRSTTYIDEDYCYRSSSVLCRIVGWSVTILSPTTAQPIEMSFGLRIREGPRNHVLDGKGRRGRLFI